jgi:hypothetical protein
MDVYEPRVRRRGFFLHSTDGSEPETGEHENPEGVAVRVRVDRSPAPAPRQFASQGRQLRTAGRTDEGRSQVRSVSATGSRQRSHLPR